MSSTGMPVRLETARTAAWALSSGVKDGVVVAMMSGEQPMSDDFLTPGVAVEAVIELNAGTAQASR